MVSLYHISSEKHGMELAVALDYLRGPEQRLSNFTEIAKAQNFLCYPPVR